MPHAMGGTGHPTAADKPTLRLAAEPAVGAEADEARTRRLALDHYENFSVISRLLPRQLRQDFCNVYAFCRVADDLADEAGDPRRARDLLEDFRAQTLECFAGRARTVVFSALAHTIRRHDLPAQPFLDLIDAFVQDQEVTRYATFEQLLDYCRRSANPVGRLVLCMSGYRDRQRFALSDATCTGLQLANFWQDVRRDLEERNRIYIPAQTMAKFGVTESQLRENRCDNAFRQMLRFEVDRAAEYLHRGQGLLPLLETSIRPQISLFGMGGGAVLHAIRRRDYDVLSARPALSRWDKTGLILRALVRLPIELLRRPGGRR